jgi:hypothetical protein
MQRVVTATPRGSMRKTDYMRRLEAQAVYAYGLEFLRVALKSGSELVRPYLLGHALELFLKAYLLNSGYTPTQLRTSYGHNIAKLLRGSKQNDLEHLVRISVPLESDIEQFSAIYASKRLEYFSSLDLLSPWRLPAERRMIAFVQLFARKLKSYLPKP